MDREKKAAGILGIAGAGLFLIVSIIAILIFEDGVYSPANCFVTELGLYTGGYLSVSSALVFNIGMLLSGLAFVAFMVMWGMQKNTGLNTAVSFFGILAGVLIAALAIFSLNFQQYHYILTIALFISIFIMCALYIVSDMRSLSKVTSPAKSIVAFLAGITGIIFAGYTLWGGMAQVFYEDAKNVGRLMFLPFALVEWVAFLSFIALIVLLAVGMLKDGGIFKSEFDDHDEKPKNPGKSSANINKADTRKIEL